MCECVRSWPLQAKLPGGALPARSGPRAPSWRFTSLAAPSSPFAPIRKHCRSSAVVIRHEHPLARLVQTQVARAGAFRRHRVHQLEPPFGALDLVRAYRPAGHTLVHQGLVRRIEARPGGVQRQTCRVCRVGKRRTLRERPGRGVHLEQVNAFAPGPERPRPPPERCTCRRRPGSAPARRQRRRSRSYRHRISEGRFLRQCDSKTVRSPTESLAFAP